MKCISEQFYNAHQSWNYRQVVSEVGVVFQVDIRRNAYDDQSHVLGKLFDPAHLCWNTVISEPIQSAHCKVANYVRKQESIEPFRADAKSVLDNLKAIVKAAKS